MSALKVGQRIVSSGDEWEVLEVEEDRLRLRVHAVSDLLRRYLDVGSEYVARPTPACSTEEIWEIPRDQMKRRASQVILYQDLKTMAAPDIDLVS